MKHYKLLLKVIGLVVTLSISQQINAAKPMSIVCGNGKTVKLTGVKNSRAAQARLCMKAGNPAPRQNSTSRGKSPVGGFSSQGSGRQKALLLPAVQAAREAARPARKYPRYQADRKSLSSGASNPAADTSCNGVNACNDMIATCLSLGGNVTNTSYDPGSGAPNGATCFSPQ